MSPRKSKKNKNAEDSQGYTDELIDSVYDELNGMYKDQDVAYRLAEDSPNNVRNWFSTGCTPLDVAISNSKGLGGIPSGRITELLGWEASGKSLVAMTVLANCQKQGGIACLVDTENSLERNFAEAIGLDLEKLIYVQPDTIEQAYEVIEKVIVKYKSKNNKAKDKNPLVIVFDSAAAAPTSAELDGDYEKEGWATGKAIINSKAMRKITNLIGKENASLLITNQLRQKLGVTFGDASTTSGGKAIGFHASVRIKLKRIGRINNKQKEVIGQVVRAEIVKNKLGPAYRKTDFDVYFSKGIDDYSAWLRIAKENDLVKGGAWHKIIWPSEDLGDGEDISFRQDDWEDTLAENPKYKAWLYGKLTEIIIMKYETPKSVDEIEKVIDLEEELSEGETVEFKESEEDN